MTLTIAQAVFPDDDAAIRKLMREYIDSLGLDLSFQDVETELATLPGPYVPPRGRMLLARLDGAPVGIGALRPLPDGSAEMKRMYLRPAARGMGAGRQLAVAIVTEARDAGYPLIRLDTQLSLTTAVALYRSLGFVETPRYNDNPLPNSLFMSLDLTRPAA